MSNFNFKVDITFDAGMDSKLQKVAEETMKEVAAELDGRFDDAISSAVWSWPGQSKRGLSGSTVGERAKAWKAASFNTGTTRSIVDSGELKQSKVYNLKGTTAEWVWTANYAAAVHEGARIHPWGDPKNGTVSLPGRPWTTAVLEGGTGAKVPVYNFTEEFTKRFTSKLK